MFDELGEIIKKNPIRWFCLRGVVVVAGVELAVRIIILPRGELIGYETIRVVPALASATLGLIAFYPPQSLRGIRYWVFYISAGFLAIERCLGTVMATYYNARLPGWTSILNASLILAFLGSLFLDQSSPIYRMKTIIIVISILLITILTYILS